MTSPTIPTDNSGNVAALSLSELNIGDAHKNNIKDSRKVLDRYLTVLASKDSKIETDESTAPSIPEPPGTSQGDFKEGLGAFGSKNALDISYIVALVLLLANEENKSLSEEQALQVEANQLQYSSGITAANNAAAGFYAAAGAGFSALVSLASIAVEVTGSIRSAKSANAKANALGPIDDPDTDLVNDTKKANTDANKNANTTATARPGRSEQNQARTIVRDNINTDEQENAQAAQTSTRTQLTEDDLLNQHIRNTDAISGATPENPATAETALNDPATSEANSPSNANNRSGNVANRSGDLDSASQANPASNANQTGSTTPAGNANEPGTTTQTGNANEPGTTTQTDNANEPGSATQTGNANEPGTTTQTGNANEPGTTTQTGNANEPGTTTQTDNANQTGSAKDATGVKNNKNAEPDSHVEKLAKRLREALKSDTKDKITAIKKEEVYNREYDRSNAPWQRTAHGLQALSQILQAGGSAMQGWATGQQLNAQALAQLQGSGSQSAAQTVQQLQELANTIRSIVSSLLQSEFSLAGKA